MRAKPPAAASRPPNPERNGRPETAGCGGPVAGRRAMPHSLSGQVALHTDQHWGKNCSGCCPREEWMFRSLCLIAAASVSLAMPAAAQQDAASYPNKPVRVVVTVPAGGGVDT